MKVKFLDLSFNDINEKKQLHKIFEKTLKSGIFSGGNSIKNFEKKISKYFNSKFSVGTGSGSSALYIALKSLGVGVGDEVITTPFTWIITTNAIVSTGAKPVFADICDDFNIDPESIKKLISSKTKAIVPMHMSGHMCEMFEISKIARENYLHIVEDAAHALCSSLNNQKAGSFSSVAAYSINPMKMLGDLGECGVVSTNKKKYYDKLLMLRHAGVKPSANKLFFNNSFYPSLNHKIDSLHASFLIFLLKKLKHNHSKRSKIAKIYDSELKDIVKLQGYHDKEIHGRHLYSFQCDRRDKLLRFLNNKKIETKIYYYPLCSDVAYFNERYKNINIPNARRIVKAFLSIPLYEKLSMDQVEYVINSIKKFYK